MAFCTLALMENVMKCGNWRPSPSLYTFTLMEKVIACVLLVELVTSLILSHLQKNIQNTLFLFALVSAFSLLIDAVNRHMFDLRGNEEYIRYSNEMIRKFDALDYQSRQKESYQEFTSKLERAANSRRMLINWGFSAVSSCVMSVIGLTYVVVSEECYSVIAILVTINVLWYILVSSKLSNKVGEMRKTFRVVRKKCEERSRLLIIQIHDNPHSVKKVDELMSIKQNMEEKGMDMNDHWTKTTITQRMPNYLVLMMVPYIVQNTKLFPMLVMVFNNVNGSLSSLSSFSNQWNSIQSDLQAMEDFWDAKTCTEKPVQEMIPDDLVMDVRLPNGVTGSDIRITRGSRIRIAGKSGAGKSSLINALMGYTTGLTFTSGEREIPDPTVFIDRIVYLQQDAGNSVPTETTTLNELFENTHDDACVLRCLEITNMVEWFKGTMAGKLDAPIERKISGGEKARLCLAISLCKAVRINAQLLVLDEFDHGLDTKNVLLIAKNMLSEFPKMTVIVTAHMCKCNDDKLGITHTWLIEDGRIVVTTNMV